LRFLADECCDAGLVTSLRNEGHDVLYVPELRPGGPDEVVLRQAYQEGRVLLTEDKDFGELVYRLKKPAAGIVLIRIPVEQRRIKWLRVKRLIEKYGDRLPGHLVIVGDERFRFRPLLFKPIGIPNE
jgi:predicted nuclease of predicted toxin-antitoxin system